MGADLAQEEGVPAFTQLLVPKEYKAGEHLGEFCHDKKGFLLGKKVTSDDLTRENGD